MSARIKVFQKSALMFAILLSMMFYGCRDAAIDTADTTDKRGGSYTTVVSLLKIFSSVEQPTHITNAGDGSGRMFITEQCGRIRVAKNGVLRTTPFLDIRHRVRCGGERGLLSIAFPPNYLEKRRFYVNYTDRNGDTVIARYRTSPDPDIADHASEEILLKIEQPFPNHNGGLLVFGPDGYLYIGMGDGGAAGDPFNNSQKPGTLLGKMLRIDVESGVKPYSIPPDNPFVKVKGYRPEIWAMGLRNPWRYSFDPATGDLYIADVGQNRYEEVNFQPASSKGGENYGWSIMEGMHCYRSKNCDRKGLTPPVAEYDHSQGCSITGGLVYRGPNSPSFHGTYIYGDYCSGRIWGLRRAGDTWESELLAETGYAVSTFGEDEKGDIYVANHREGIVYMMEFSTRNSYTTTLN